MDNWVPYNEHDELVRAMQQIAQLEEAWIAVVNRMPPDGTSVIAWAPNGKEQVKNLMKQVLYYRGDWCYGSPYSNRLSGVTHWLPMPEPPDPDHDGQKHD